MTLRRTSSIDGARVLPRGGSQQRRTLTNLGLLTGVILVGSLAAALWVRMVLF